MRGGACDSAVLNHFGYTNKQGLEALGKGEQQHQKAPHQSAVGRLLMRQVLVHDVFREDLQHAADVALVEGVKEAAQNSGRMQGSINKIMCKTCHYPLPLVW